ncbi:hypothetical protein PSTG_01508 [Puccinia striiformis f. sp. tritici PST-78]|uniref:Uncharacterized protein n=1 Tax=Puccinia striiformis f. sp. tritici PST-78 TaxID=1165861 RepID=A0A0L0W1A7_9BASI|nr:hypothetical protein PSTG_01508 [Puccinia striiformis f. sp. tritici PST-78]
MSDLEKKFEQLMKVANEERELRQKAEADLAAARAASAAAATLAAEELAKANAAVVTALTNSSDSPKEPKMGLPDKFLGARGDPAELRTGPRVGSAVYEEAIRRRGSVV